MESNKNKIEEIQQIQIESEAAMGFILSNSLARGVESIAPVAWGSDEAVIIPNSGGQVLVGEDTKACLERKADPKILMIPYKVTAKIGGVRHEKNFFVCTK